MFSCHSGSSSLSSSSSSSSSMLLNSVRSPSSSACLTVADQSSSSEKTETHCFTQRSVYLSVRLPSKLHFQREISTKRAKAPCNDWKGGGQWAKQWSCICPKRRYHQTGWIGTVKVNRDTKLEPGKTQTHNVSPGSSPASRFTSTVPIHPV